MGVIADHSPMIARMAGVWDGEYVHLDADSHEIDRHRVRLLMRLEDGADGEAYFSQTNIYTWPDETQEIRYFDGYWRGDRIWIKNDLIDGWTGPVALDHTGRTSMVHWTHPHAPNVIAYEIVTMSEDHEQKNRTWQVYVDGRLARRTLINETRIAVDWRPYDDPKYYQHTPRGDNGAK